METSLGFLFAALLVTWIVIGLYLYILSGRLATLRREVEALERDSVEGPGQDDGAGQR